MEAPAFLDAATLIPVKLVKSNKKNLRQELQNAVLPSIMKGRSAKQVQQKGAWLTLLQDHNTSERWIQSKSLCNVTQWHLQKHHYHMESRWASQIDTSVDYIAQVKMTQRNAAQLECKIGYVYGRLSTKFNSERTSFPTTQVRWK